MSNLNDVLVNYSTQTQLIADLFRDPSISQEQKNTAIGNAIQLGAEILINQQSQLKTQQEQVKTIKERVIVLSEENRSNKIAANELKKENFERQARERISTLNAQMLGYFSLGLGTSILASATVIGMIAVPIIFAPAAAVGPIVIGEAIVGSAIGSVVKAVSKEEDGFSMPMMDKLAEIESEIQVLSDIPELVLEDELKKNAINKHRFDKQNYHYFMTETKEKIKVKYYASLEDV